MKMTMLRTLVLMMLAACLVLPACDEEEPSPGLSVLLYTPQNANLAPIPSSLQKLRFSAVQSGSGQLLSSQTVNLSAGSADFSGIPYGEDLQIVVEGINTLDNTIMRGRSTPFSFFPDSTARRVPVLMMELEQFSSAAALQPGLGDELRVLPVAFETAHTRAGHTATRLDSGRLLIVGGATLGNDGFDLPWVDGDQTVVEVRSEVELYDPATGTFLRLPDMRFQRAFHTTTLLDDGRILVVGGVTVFDKDDGPVLETVKPAEIFDPQTQTWTVISGTSAPRLGRAWHSAVQRKIDGRVVIAGGRSVTDGEGSVLDTAEVFNPDTLSFEGNAGGGLIQLGVPRADHTAVLSGASGPGRGANVFLIGGRNEAGVIGSIETLRSVNSNSRFEALIDLPQLRAPRYGHASLRVSPENGNLVLIAGGEGEDGTLDSIEVLDVAGSVVATAGSMTEPRAYPQILELPQTNDVVVLGGAASGGDPTATAEKLQYKVDTGRYETSPIAASMETPRFLHTATLLSNGLVLMTGGIGADGQSLDSVEVFNPDDGSPVQSAAPATDDGRVDPEPDENNGDFVPLE